MPDLLPPSVSVVIPCHNYGHFLTDAVMSALMQSDVDIEVIIVDDGSTDDSLVVAEDLASRDIRIAVVRHVQNLGLIAAVNNGIAAASGDLLVVLSADDALAPNALARVAAVFVRYECVGLVFGRRREFALSEELQAAWAAPPPLEVDPVHVHPGQRWLDRRCRQGVNLLASPEVVVRMDAQRSVGPYSERCRHTSDLNMWLRIAAQFDVAHVGGAPLAWYRRHGANMSTVVFGERAVDALECWAAFDDALARHSGTPWERRMRDARQAIIRPLLHEARRIQESGLSDGSTRDRLVNAAAAIDPDTTRTFRRADGTVRRDALGRLAHRWRWLRWLHSWLDRGW